MAPIPVFCDNCGAMWINDRLFGVPAGGAAHIQMTNVGVGPCPTCGGMGHVIDGAYELTSDSVRIFARLPIELRVVLRDEVEKARHDASPEDLAQRIEALAATVEAQDVRADVQAIARDIKRLSRADWKYWLLLAATCLGPGLAGKVIAPTSGPPAPVTSTTTAPANAPTPSDAEIGRIVQQIIEQTGTSTTTRVARVGRNQACPCGSGKKYKFCHGRS